jgi:hypothetical protein
MMGSFGGFGGRLKFVFPYFSLIKNFSNITRKMDAKSKEGWKLSFSHARKAIGVLMEIKVSI